MNFAEFLRSHFYRTPPVLAFVYYFIYSVNSKVVDCVPEVLAKFNSFVDIFFKKSYNMEEPFDKHLFLQNTFYWMLLALTAASRQGRLPQKSESIVSQKNIYRGTLENISKR